MNRPFLTLLLLLAGVLNSIGRATLCVADPVDRPQVATNKAAQYYFSEATAVICSGRDYLGAAELLTSAVRIGPKNCDDHVALACAADDAFEPHADDNLKKADPRLSTFQTVWAALY